jgi:acetyl esterase/lipase
MTLWPEEYEPLREEARAVGRAAANAFREQMADLPPEEHLARGRAFLAAQAQDGRGGRDEEIAGIACRVFDPAGDDRGGTYLNIHGGAMMWGSPRMNDLANAEVAESLGVRVVSPDYRLAPEHPHPAGADDCLAVAEWVLEHERGLVVVGGESAGAYFSALTLLRIRDDLDAIDRVAGANLVFGCFDLSGTPSNRGSRPTDLPEILEGNTRYVLEGFLPGRTREDARDPSISPLYADLWNLPPALFTVGLADRLLDDSLFMAARWEAFGNQAALEVYPDCAHGFTFFPIKLARIAGERINAFIGRSIGA